MERAHSLVVNAHKWLFTPMDLSVFYTRRPDILRRAFTLVPEYLRTPENPRAVNLMDYAIPLGRRFRALKLWLTLREQGAEAIRARLRRDLANAQWLAAQIDAAPHWRRVAPVVLQTVCVRHEPPGLDAAALDAHTRRWTQAINDSGVAYLTPAVVDGRWMTRVSIGMELTEAVHVGELWQAMRAAADASASA